MALVPQEVNVVPDLTVAENICLNLEPRRFGMIDTPARHAAAKAALRGFGLDIDPSAACFAQCHWTPSFFCSR